MRLLTRRQFIAAASFAPCKLEVHGTPAMLLVAPSATLALGAYPSLTAEILNHPFIFHQALR